MGIVCQMFYLSSMFPYLFLTFLGNVDTFSISIKKGNECRVLNDERDPCVFPFNYGNTTYHQCTDVDETYFWCATEVDESLEATEWGECGESCPKKANPTSKTVDLL